MNLNWDLSVLYSGPEDVRLQQDLETFDRQQKEFHELVLRAPSLPEQERAEQLLLSLESSAKLSRRLADYLALSRSVDTENGTLLALLNRVMRIASEGAADESAAEKLLGSLADPDSLAERSPLLREYRFVLEQARKHCAHLLSDDAEAMAAAMDMTGGDAWGTLQSYLTSTVTGELNGETKTLSELRNLAGSPDAAVRRAAYDAELACYPKIADSVAFALNNIKNQVTLLSEKRNFESPLAQALEQSHMSRATLDAMLDAVKEALPSFRRYFKAKAKLLGFENGLPWFELFAPVGKSGRTFTTEECRDYLVSCFSDFAPDMAAMMREAFDNRWIDFMPAAGKEGGAFCEGFLEQDESRILTNFDGTFSAVDTLAHELGHAYHNRCIADQRVLNKDYPMPIAETASTFNETFLGSYALKSASAEEKLALLDSDLREKSQCVVDIYSRYLFESRVFEEAGSKFLMAEDLKAMMLECQDASYGDGLDPEFRHPYMWVCKSHYYSSGFSFYNFPYTFGSLFAQGLYHMYEEQGEAFLPRYREMLRTTPVHTIEEDGAVMGADLTKPGFWQGALRSVEAEIDEFCRLCGENA